MKTNVRGIPFETDEIVAKELELGGMLFDESAFDTETKRIACANVITQLDIQLRKWQEKNLTRDLPQYIDIDDRSWLYVPVNLFPPNSSIVTPRTSRLPAGLVGWFRVKRSFSVRSKSWQ